MASIDSASGDYPVRYAVDYAEGRDRVSVLFRILLIIPAFVLASGLSVVGAPVALMLLFRHKYPGWWFEWNRELSRFNARLGATSTRRLTKSSPYTWPSTLRSPRNSTAGSRW